MAATKVTDERTIAQFINELLDNEPPIEPNEVVDPSAVLTDPAHADGWVPKDSSEFRIALANVVDVVPDDAIATVYAATRDAADSSVLAADSQSQVNNLESPVEDTKMSVDRLKKFKESVRQYVRSVLIEVTSGNPPAFSSREEEDDEDISSRPPVVSPENVEIEDDEDGPLPEIPSDEDGEPLPRMWKMPPNPIPFEDDETEKDKFGLETAPSVDVADAAADAERISNELGEPRGYAEVAKELGISVAGAKQAIDKAMMKLRFLKDLDDEIASEGNEDEGKSKLEKLIFLSVASYIDELTSTGELTREDEQTLKDNAELVVDLEGFRGYLHDIVWDVWKKHPKWKYTGKSGGGWTRLGDKQNESLGLRTRALIEDMKHVVDDKATKFKCSACGKEKVSKNKYTDGKSSVCAACYSTSKQKQKQN